MQHANALGKFVGSYITVSTTNSVQNNLDLSTSVRMQRLLAITNSANALQAQLLSLRADLLNENGLDLELAALSLHQKSFTEFDIPDPNEMFSNWIELEESKIRLQSELNRKNAALKSYIQLLQKHETSLSNLTNITLHTLNNRSKTADSTKGKIIPKFIDLTSLQDPTGPHTQPIVELDQIETTQPTPATTVSTPAFTTTETDINRDTDTPIQLQIFDEANEPSVIEIKLELPGQSETAILTAPIIDFQGLLETLDQNSFSQLDEVIVEEEDNDVNMGLVGDFHEGLVGSSVEGFVNEWDCNKSVQKFMAADDFELEDITEGLVTDTMSG
ncbi:hypothetical protein HK096_009678, partial [Nowakowskiella sp. JEL0078]